MLHTNSVAIVTDSGGDATVYLGSNVLGWIERIKYLPGTIATGGDLVITGETSGVPILTVTNAGTANIFWYPRVFPNSVADAAAGTVPAHRVPLTGERVKVVVAQGGATKTGSIELVYDDDVHG